VLPEAEEELLDPLNDTALATGLDREQEKELDQSTPAAQLVCDNTSAAPSVT
jgi:hypothetical protein